MKTIRILLGVALVATWAAVVGNIGLPTALFADSASCSSGGCRCSISDTDCACISGGGGCTAFCVSGGKSKCGDGGGK